MTQAAFLGRQAECSRLDQLMGRAAAGQSDALVLRGMTGIGKTALLDYTAQRAEGCRRIRAHGVESESGLPFAALHRLCLPLLDGLGHLPGPQRAALETAFGLTSGPQADRFLVGLAVLSLLSDAAKAQPLLCLVDDAQWLDRSSAQVLSFVARRLPAAPIIFLFARRDDAGFDGLAGLPELRLMPLSVVEARALFASARSGTLDERVRDRMIAEAGGHPGALLECALGISGSGVAGGYAVPGISPLPSPIEAVHRLVGQLPHEAQRLLLVAAAEPTGNAALLWRAAAALGVPIAAAAPAEADGFVAVGARVTFGSSLLRSAIYHGASEEERSVAHRVLAEAIDPAIDPDGQAWHRARAAIDPDEDLASRIEGLACQAQRRGGIAAAAAFLEEATRLTPDPARKSGRAVAAAQAKHHAGESDAAVVLLASARAMPLNDLQGATADQLMAQIAFEEALFSDRVSGPDDVVEAAKALQLAFPASTPDPSDLLLHGLARLVTEGHGAATPILRPAFDLFRSGCLSPDVGLRWRWLAGMVALVLWDDETVHADLDDVVSRGARFREALRSYRAALAANGLGHYEDACTAAERVCRYDDLVLAGLGLTELVEAAARSGQSETAEAALHRLEEHTGASATDWALGIAARSRALLSEGDVAERLYQEAIERLGRTRLRSELARAHLVYGEWLRREKRRLEARQELRTAHGLFTSLGIEGFADRASGELFAAGETVRQGSVETGYDLTDQEAQIARLAADGNTNSEIGAQLFLSARTVEWHLRKVFAKVGISSRKELRRALETPRMATQAA